MRVKFRGVTPKTTSRNQAGGPDRFLWTRLIISRPPRYADGCAFRDARRRDRSVAPGAHPRADPIHHGGCEETEEIGRATPEKVTGKRAVLPDRHRRTALFSCKSWVIAHTEYIDGLRSSALSSLGKGVAIGTSALAFVACDARYGTMGNSPVISVPYFRFLPKSRKDETT